MKRSMTLNFASTAWCSLIGRPTRPAGRPKLPWCVVVLRISQHASEYVRRTHSPPPPPHSPQAPLEFGLAGDGSGPLTVKIDNTNAFTSTDDLSFSWRVVLNGAPLDLGKAGADEWRDVQVSPIAAQVSPCSPVLCVALAPHALCLSHSHSPHLRSHRPPWRWASKARKLRRRPNLRLPLWPRLALRSCSWKCARSWTKRRRGVMRYVVRRV